MESYQLVDTLPISWYPSGVALGMLRALTPIDTPTLVTPHAAPDRAALPPIHVDVGRLAAPALLGHLDALTAERERSDDRDAALRAALREWGAREFGSVDEFAVEVGRRMGRTFSHVRNSLFGPRSNGVLDAAVAVYRERAVEGAAEGASGPSAPS